MASDLDVCLLRDIDPVLFCSRVSLPAIFCDLQREVGCHKNVSFAACLEPPDHHDCWLICGACFAHLNDVSYIPEYEPNYKEMWREITFSVKSLVTMSAMVTPSEILVHKGFTKLYGNVDEYGIVYFILSPILFLLFSDFIIYWVHRFLHHRLFYKYIHKPHHSFVHTTPFAAFAFHPLDGYMQGVAYHIFVYFIPFHTFMHLASLAIVGLWTINIHDRVDMGIPLINGAGHHRVHHLTFNHNYGQYFVICDW